MSEDSTHRTIPDEMESEARERAKDAATPRIAPYPLEVVDAQFLRMNIESSQTLFTIKRSMVTTGTISYQYENADIAIFAFELQALAIDLTAIFFFLSPLLQDEEFDISSLVGGAILFAEDVIDSIEQQEEGARELLITQRPKTRTRRTITSPFTAVNRQDAEAIIEFARAKRGPEESDLTKWVREEFAKGRSYKDVQNAFLVKTKVDISNPKEKTAGRNHFSKICSRIKERGT